ncbi:hypothetical protein GY45DRAFT_1338862 [Cubamyces sp. BRFM 1775]|nr:hypothetical protein GY45DRAFT_1338862 [Cubamyces sp. BRFM 1775]
MTHASKASISSILSARHQQRTKSPHAARSYHAPSLLDPPDKRPHGAASRRPISDTPTITGIVDGRRVSDEGFRAEQHLACSRLDPWCGPLVAVGRLAAPQSGGGAAKQRLNSGVGGSVGRADNSPQFGRRSRAVGPPSPGYGAFSVADHHRRLDPIWVKVDNKASATI